MVDVMANWQAVQDRIAQAAQRSGRSPESIQVVAVTKGIPVEGIAPLIDSGIAAIGENRVQEALAKHAAAEWREKIEWHFIGHLQTNKVKQCLQVADLIHSVDSVRLLQEINRRAEAMGLEQVRVLLQVMSAGKYQIRICPRGASQSTGKPCHASGSLSRLMTMAPARRSERTVRFQELRL